MGKIFWACAVMPVEGRGSVRPGEALGTASAPGCHDWNNSRVNEPLTPCTPATLHSAQGPSRFVKGGARKKTTPSSYSCKPPFRAYLGTDNWMLLFVSCHLAEERSPEAKRSVGPSLNQKSSFVLAISPRAITLLKSCLRYQHLGEVTHARIAWGAEGSSDKFYLFQRKYGSLSSPEDTNP